jgi:lipoprotein NlpI
MAGNIFSPLDERFPMATRDSLMAEPPRARIGMLVLSACLLIALPLAWAKADGHDDAKAATAAARAGRDDEALRLYNRALASTDLPPRDRAAAYYNRGTIYVGEGKFDDALADYTLAIHLAPDFAEAHHNRGHIYANNRQYDQAIVDYDAAIQLKPGWFQALMSRGYAFLQKGDYERAVADYNAAIALNPTNPDVYVMRGAAYTSMGAYDRGRADDDTAIRLKPDLPEAFSDRGTTYLADGRYDDAIADFTAAIRLNPRLTLVHQYAGIAKFELTHFGEAAAEFAQTLKLAPTNPYAAILLHIARRKAGVDDAAEFAGNASKLTLEGWPKPIVALYLGKITPQQALAVRQRLDAEKQRRMRCEAAFYIGEFDLLVGDERGAKPLLKEVVDQCRHQILLYDSARTDLSALEPP